MVRSLVIRRATTGDREAVLGIATAGMQEFGLVPDFAGLDVELGRIGEDHEGTIAEFVAVVGTAVCGCRSCEASRDGALVPRNVGPDGRSGPVIRIDRLGTWRRPSSQQWR